MSERIEFDATVNKVQTLVDQGLRVSFDLPETAIVAAAQLMAAKRQGAILHVVIEMQYETVGNENAIQKRTERKSSRPTS
jgi:hypothetical protein